MNKLILISILTICPLQASTKIYIDNESLDSTQEAFRVHVGSNIWIETKTVHRDMSGLYMFDDNIKLNGNQEYKKSWKCPYCYAYWPIGKSCQNAECPSKYK